MTGVRCSVAESVVWVPASQLEGRISGSGLSPCARKALGQFSHRCIPKAKARRGQVADSPFKACPIPISQRQLGGVSRAAAQRRYPGRHVDWEYGFSVDPFA